MNDGEQRLSKTTELLNLQEQAARGNWDEEKLQALEDKIESGYPDLTPTGAKIAEEYDQAKSTAPETSAAVLLAESQDKARREVELATRAATEDWPQERVDVAQRTIK